MLVRDETQWAWAAGLFEGEGSIVRHKGGIRFQLKMTDEDVVRHFAEVVGVGSVIGPYLPSDTDGHTRKPVWLWHTAGRLNVAAVAYRLYPLLGRRRRARIEELGLLNQMRLSL